MAAPSAHFLLGEANWVGNGRLPARLPHEIDAPEPWSQWRRQRLQPHLVNFLFPAAWSIFLLAAGGIPLLLNAIGHGIGMELRLGLSLWIGAFFLLWLSD